VAGCGVWEEGTAAVTLEPDELREGRGREGRARLPCSSLSFLGTGVAASLRTESADGARAPPPELRLVFSWWAGSAPGTGEGALEPLAAAAFNICALSWAAWRSDR
jgi:hypothetical protein